MTTTTKNARYTKNGARFYSIDGRQLPSVTSITAMLNKPALPNWAAKLTRERMCDEAASLYAVASGPSFTEKAFRAELWKRVEKRAFQNEFMREAADLGTLAHAQCEWIVNRAMGGVMGPDPITCARATAETDEARLIIDRALWASMSFDQWVTDHDVKFIASELMVADPVVGYAGTLDLVAVVDGRRAVVDLKTSSGIWPEMYLQVAAYWNAYNIDTVRPAMENMETAYILRLPKKLSDPDFEYVEIDDLPGHFAAFCALAKVFAWSEGVTK